MSMENEARSDRPSTSRNKEVIEKVCQIVMEDRRLTLREIVEQVRISRGSPHSILTEDLCMRRMPAKFIPELLTEQQKDLRMEIAQNMLDCANNDLEFTKTMVIRPGFMVTIQKSSFNLHNGSIRNHQNPKKHDKFAAM